ncbi:hypothetical protein NZNM25_08220 [Nitrosopumilus zosterae]|uniref:Uncharacterized protein n=1 Tax=Nitrosopumilus zosterae TaxID=718286 RepID=A0A2S2KR68_9ARCH|nr:hypothetical protein [Nitrosopumilus zosterae]BDQ30535.1 hypothetical protein NZOSNM25_000639 [Nitrosopumilus zosterae]GBH34031.1 hypothetical protein NZNM25_08220 [Nitrosopumilus zosterae]
MWKLETDDGFFRIYDSKKMVAGYFDPDYGDIFPKENSEEIVASMLKNHDKILGGVVMVPLVKFGLFDTDLDTDINTIEQNITRVNEHLQKWKNFLSDTDRQTHSIRISHTDQDMLTITFEVKFSKPTPLETKHLQEELFTTLDLLQKSGLL